MFGTYDDWKGRAPEYDEDPLEPCPVCTGDVDSEPCSEDCAELVESVRRARLVKGNYEAAKRALHLAKVYAMEGGPHDRRIGPCIKQVRYYRDYIRTLRRAS